MAIDAFLKIDGIPGESTDEKHSEWIEILSYTFSASQSSSGSRSTGGAASSGRVDFSDFSIMKGIDIATNKLLEHVCTGKHISEITLEICTAAAEKTPYVLITMKDVLITQVAPAGSAGGDPMETVSFNFGQITCTYTQLDHATGAKKGNVAFGWDLEKNKSC